MISMDEIGTIRTLTVYREAMSNLIQQYKGRVVDLVDRIDQLKQNPVVKHLIDTSRYPSSR